jgi:hypothetical protein
MLMRALSAGCILVVSTFVNAAALRDEVDRFTGMRTIEWQVLPDAENLFAFKTTVRISEGDILRDYEGRLITYGKSRFHDCHRVHWLLDGKRAPLIKTRYFQQPLSGGLVIEYFEILDGEHVLPLIAAAQVVEFSVCGEEGVIAEKELAGLKKVLAVSRGADQ